MTMTREQIAMDAATRAVRTVIAQSKDPRTRLSRMSPTMVAFHAAWAAIDAHTRALEACRISEYRARAGI